MNVIGAITYADFAGFPAGSVVDHIAVSVTGGPLGDHIQNVAPDSPSVSFSLDAGDYGFSVVAQAADGSALGSPVTGSFSVTAPQTVTLHLPAAVVFTQDAA